MMMSDNRGKGERWKIVEPKTPLPCTLVVFAPESRIEDLSRIQEDKQDHRFVVRAILSDHIPLAGSLIEILDRPSYHKLAVNGRKLSIYLHHGGKNVTYFDLIGAEKTGLLDYIEVIIQSKYPINCFWAARTAVSQLLDAMMRTMWLPLTIRRLDLHLEGDEKPLCHQLFLPFTNGVRWGPLGGIHQYNILAPYESLIREAVFAISPYYRLLCAYRLYEGLQSLRKKLHELSERFAVKERLPKPPLLDSSLLRDLGFAEDLISKVKNLEDFWKYSTELRNGVSHFLLENEIKPLSLSDGQNYYIYSLVGAALLHYSHAAFKDLSIYLSDYLGAIFEKGSILPNVEKRAEYVLRPDT